MVTTVGCSQAPEQPSFVLISLDTLRADRLGAYGYSTAVTPNLDAFAAQSVLFEQAYAQANVTNMSHASLFSSRYASELGPANDAFVPATDVPLLAEILSAYDYQTAAAAGGGHLFEGLGLDRGFASFVRPAPLGSLYHTAPEALSMLDAMDDQHPYLLFVHGYDTHLRYLKPSPLGLLHTDPDYAGPGARAARDPTGTAYVLDERYYEGVGLGPLVGLRQARVWGQENRVAIHERAESLEATTHELKPADLNYLSAVYDGAVTYMDAHFGLLMAELEQRGVLDDAWVVVVSDHGESLGEDGLFCHNMALNDATLHVPLIIRPPGGLAEGLRVPGATALLDVLPTLLELAQIPDPALIHGRSLLPALQGEPHTARRHIFSEGQVRMVTARSDAGQLTLQGVSAESPYLEALLAVAQLDGTAFELSPSDDPATRQALRAAMLDWRQSLRPSRQQAQQPTRPQIEAMRKHGYWSTR